MPTNTGISGHAAGVVIELGEGAERYACVAAGVCRHSRANREGETPVVRRSPPTVHNEQSSCRDIASLLAW